MKLNILVKTGMHQGLSFSTEQVGTYRIGRAADADLALPKDAYVSNKHCDIEFRKSGVYFRDVGSRNGTYINSRRIRETQLSNGDILLVGRSAISVTFSDDIPLTKTIECPEEVQGFTLIKVLPSNVERKVYWAIPDGQSSFVMLHFIHTKTEPGVSDKNVSRLMREANIICRVQDHPGILPLRGQGFTGNVMWFATGFVDAKELNRIVERRKTLSLEDTMEVGIQAADILAHLHEAGIVHRSLCPASLWISQKGKMLGIYLVDLASAKWLQIEELLSITTVGECGYHISPFTAPEAFTDYKTLDPRSDIYSLGAVLYFLLTGRIPHDVPESEDVVMTILETDPLPLAQLNPNLSHSVVNVVERAMSRDINTRYSTAREMRDDLRRTRKELKIYRYNGKQYIAPSLPIKAIRSRWALLVGVNHYIEPAFSPLKFCVNDVLGLEKMLKRYGYTVAALHDNVTKEHLLPTRENVEAELIRICQVLNPHDLLWIHFACHGKLLRNGQPVLITREIRAPTLHKKALPLTEIEHQMRKSQARRLILTLDACHVGIEMGRDLIDDPEFIRNAYELAEGFALIAASTAQQVAQEWEEKKHGVFTYCLLEGLSGKADRTNKGFITVDDIRTHVLDSLRRWNIEYGSHIQEPTARTEGMGDIILGKNPKN